ncbi:uncharacterized protein MELLADRAFT_124241 [Melampsora larici-populina 98AG31]|uniref:Secreted protein n=1 Tax=Melampsora larici-populina (strain 98AG31 / pathotype 3-4-7) TaxID=747676 RepID=F4S665_MELLP|nr:uncharacterized protein MELLADRAFT_124241 [Melampsora larici-populina 98AG31]EGF99881.1 secreted protein [Melampsora larici-populina 98AG31]
MSWKGSIPIFHLLLVFLLVGNLGSHIFVHANALDCTYGWGSPTNKLPYLCLVSQDSGVITYLCEWCGRNDKLIPSASDCVDVANTVVNKGKLWTCDDGIKNALSPRPDGRQIVCRHTEQDKTINPYYCKTQVVFEQCPREKCKPPH